MSYYAVIDEATNVVDNVIVLNDPSQWTPPDNHHIVNIDDVAVGIGWSYNQSTNQWTPPPEPVLSPDYGTEPTVL